MSDNDTSEIACNERALTETENFSSIFLIVKRHNEDSADDDDEIGSYSTANDIQEPCSIGFAEDIRHREQRTREKAEVMQTVGIESSKMVVDKDFLVA